MITIHLTVNGESVAAEVRPDETLLSLLRSRLGLTGTKESCAVGECGACTVILDGMAVKSCVTLAAQCDGKTLVTIEGLEQNGELHPLQRCFVETNAVQCGFCTPGFIMTALAYLGEHPNPTREEIRSAISGNLCRCTGYEQIIDAIEAYAKQNAG
jgi:aerobic carbon-monoxide dehydrogenase small subunit